MTTTSSLDLTGLTLRERIVTPAEVLMRKIFNSGHLPAAFDLKKLKREIDTILNRTPRTGQLEYWGDYVRFDLAEHKKAIKIRRTANGDTSVIQARYNILYGTDTNQFDSGEITGPPVKIGTIDLSSKISGLLINCNYQEWPATDCLLLRLDYPIEEYSKEGIPSCKIDIKVKYSANHFSVNRKDYIAHEKGKKLRTPLLGRLFFEKGYVSALPTEYFLCEWARLRLKDNESFDV